MKWKLLGTGIVIVLLCGIILLVVTGINVATVYPTGSKESGELPFKGSLAAYGKPYWSGEPDVYIDVNNVPDGDDFTAISSGGNAMLALRSNGSIECWGDYREGLCDFPREDNYSAISSGYTESRLALRKNGTIVRLGAPDPFGIPTGNDFVAISTGGADRALRANGTIVQWGSPFLTEIPAPPGEHFIAITSGFHHGLALRQNGTIVCWGVYEEPCDVPPGNDYVAIATSKSLSLALRATGEIVAWADDGNRQYVPPGNDYVAISTNGENSLALRSDGTVICWGGSQDAICNSSTTRNAIAASLGTWRVLVLQNPHAKEILAEEWKKTKSRISPSFPVNISAPVIHPAVYPNVPYVITAIFPVVPASVMTYISTPPEPGVFSTPIPYQDPELSTSRYIQYKEFPIISPEQAVKELKTHRLSLDMTFLWHNKIENSDKIVISNISLNYIQQSSASSVSCYQPVYRFSGYVQNGTVRSMGFVENVPATDHLVEYDFL